MRESGIRNAVHAWLKKQPDLYFVKVHGSVFGRSGIPDFVGCVAGRFFAIELKGEHGCLSPLQMHEIEKIRKARGHTCVARNLASVQAFVETVRWLQDRGPLALDVVGPGGITPRDCVSGAGGGGTTSPGITSIRKTNKNPVDG